MRVHKSKGSFKTAIEVRVRPAGSKFEATACARDATERRCIRVKGLTEDSARRMAVRKAVKLYES